MHKTVGVTNVSVYQTLGIAGITVQNQIFGVATSSNQTSLGKTTRRRVWAAALRDEYSV